MTNTTTLRESLRKANQESYNGAVLHYNKIAKMAMSNYMDFTPYLDDPYFWESELSELYLKQLEFGR